MVFLYSVIVSCNSEALVCFHKMPFEHIWLCVIPQINKTQLQEGETDRNRGADGSLSVLKTDETEFSLIAERKL